MKILETLVCLLLAFLLGVFKLEAQEGSKSYQEIDSLVFICFQKGAYSKAIPLLEEAIGKAEASLGKVDSLYVGYCSSLGFFYQESGQIKKSIEIYLDVIHLQRQIYPKNHKDIAVTLNNLASSYYAIGKYELAEPMYWEAMEIMKNLMGEEHQNYAQCMNGLAITYQDQGKLIQAEELYIKVIKIYEKNLGKPALWYATALNNLGSLYAEQKKAKAAEELYLKALAIKKKALGTTHPDYAASLNNLGSMYDGLGNLEKAETAYLEAKEIWFHSLGEFNSSYARVLINLAMVYKNKGQLEKALKYVLAAIAINSEDFSIIFPAVFSSPNAQTTSVYDPFSCQLLEQAEDYLKLSELTYRNYVVMNSSLQCILGIAKRQYEDAQTAIKRQEALKLVYTLSKTAVQINNKLRTEFINRKTNLRVLKNNAFFVNEGIKAAVSLKTPQTTLEAFGFAELSKAVLLMDAVKGSKARSFGDLPDSLIAEELSLQKQLAHLKQQKYQQQNAKDASNILAQENVLNLKIASFLAKLKDKYPKYHSLKYEGKQLGVKEVQDLLDKKTMLVEYIVGEEAVYQFCITKDSIKLYTLEPSLEDLHDKVSLFRKALSNYDFITEDKQEAYLLYTEIAHWFYEKMLSRALKNKDVSQLVIVTDGLLGHLPFEAFLQKAASLNSIDYTKLSYVLNDYAISYAYSATLWGENNSKAISSNGKLLVCGASYEPENIEEVTVIERGARTAEVTELRKSLTSLPAIEEEVAALEILLDGTFVKKRASNEAFFKKEAAKYNLIHLAMHGVLNAENPLLSSLVFTEDGALEEDNFLHAYEIAQMELKANLVVLSACETGYGKFEQGDGIASLARAFMYAGVPSLVVSLWQVNDESTALIMKPFYENLAQGMSKDKALQAAKLAYIKAANGVEGHPAFWSPFIQLGDKRPVMLVSKGRFTQLWCWGALLLGILSLGWLYKKQRRLKRNI